MFNIFSIVQRVLKDILSICSRFNAVMLSVKFRFVWSSFLMSAVIAEIASSVRTALSRTISMFSSSSVSSVFAAVIRDRLSAFVADCVVTSWEISLSRDSRWLWRAKEVAGTD